MDCLDVATQAFAPNGLLAPATISTNGKSQEQYQLNPNWVEQLMGLPVGWTQLPTAWTG